MRAAHGLPLSLAHSWGAAAIARRLGIRASAPACGPDQLTGSWWAAGLDIDENLPDDQAVLAAYRDHFGIDRIEEVGNAVTRSPASATTPSPWRSMMRHRSAQSHPHPGENRWSDAQAGICALSQWHRRTVQVPPDHGSVTDRSGFETASSLCAGRGAVRQVRAPVGPGPLQIWVPGPPQVWVPGHGGLEPREPRFPRG